MIRDFVSWADPSSRRAYVDQVGAEHGPIAGAAAMRKMAWWRICPFCQEGDHWNHQAEGMAQPSRGESVEVGACRATGTFGPCSCEARP